jgi:hypothetical protein
MNSAEEFYYTANTVSIPVKPAALLHLAGVGSSPVVAYTGSGAYFLDKLESGIWRLEVMPDVLPVSDPFAKASLSKEVRRVAWTEQSVTINLADLGAEFTIQALNTGNNISTTAQNGKVSVRPGTYLLTRRGTTKHKWTAESKSGVIRLNEFVAPQPVRTTLYVYHEPVREASAAQPLTIKAVIPGLAATDKVTLEMNSLSGMWQGLDMQPQDAYYYAATLPAAQVLPGVLQYRIVVKHNDTYTTFPGNHTGDPWAWDNTTKDTWQTFVAAPGSPLTLFDATYDRDVQIYPNLWRPEEKQFTAGQRHNELVLKLSAGASKTNNTLGFQYYIADRLQARQTDIQACKNIVVRMQLPGGEGHIKIGLIDRNGACYSTQAEVSDTFRDIRIPLADLQPDAALLLPRAYPGFQPLWFTPTEKHIFTLTNIEKLQLLLPNHPTTPNPTLFIQSIWLE